MFSFFPLKIVGLGIETQKEVISASHVRRAEIFKIHLRSAWFFFQTYTLRGQFASKNALSPKLFGMSFSLWLAPKKNSVTTTSLQLVVVVVAAVVSKFLFPKNISAIQVAKLYEVVCLLDWPLHNFVASKSVAQHFWTTHISSIFWSWGSEIAKGPVG